MGDRCSAQCVRMGVSFSSCYCSRLGVNTVVAVAVLCQHMVLRPLGTAGTAVMLTAACGGML